MKDGRLTIPSQPIAKKVLKMKRNAAAAMPAFLFVVIEVVIANTTMLNDWPAAPKIISFLLPTFSMINTAIHEAKKYSVPLQAARRRERKGLNPIAAKIVGT